MLSAILRGHVPPKYYLTPQQKINLLRKLEKNDTKEKRYLTGICGM